MRSLWILASAAALASAGCLGGGGGGNSGGGGEAANRTGQSLIQPSDANALSGVLVIPGASSTIGALPAPSVTPNAPSVQLDAQAVLPIQAGGSQARIPLTFSGTDAYNECLLQVPGADRFFRLSDSSGTTQGQLQVPVQVPSSVASGSFCFSICIGDSAGNYSNVVEQCFEVDNPLQEAPTGSAGQGGSEPAPPPVTGGGTVPQECMDLLDGVAVPSVGPCYDGCIDQVLGCVVANDCVGFPATCSDPYFSCITSCAQQQ